MSKGLFPRANKLQAFSPVRLPPKERSKHVARHRVPDGQLQQCRQEKGVGWSREELGVPSLLLQTEMRLKMFGRCV